jgi:hypothetical protein
MIKQGTGVRVQGSGVGNQLEEQLALFATREKAVSR